MRNGQHHPASTSIGNTKMTDHGQPQFPDFRLRNLIITPYYTASRPQMNQRSLEIIVENLRRYRLSEAMINQLRPEDVYSIGVA